MTKIKFNVGATYDVGLSRNPAGLMDVNNTVDGTYRDLQLRALNTTSGNVGIGTTTPTLGPLTMLRDLEDQMFLVQTLIIGALVGLVLVAFELVTERLGTVEETDVLLFDEPGRCGGLDSHCHHYRVVERHGSRLLLVRNGGGDTSIRLSGPVSIPLLSLDSNGRYWLLNAIFHAQADGAMGAYARERAVWKQAAAEKRIRTRKQRGGNGVKVWIEDKAGA